VRISTAARQIQLWETTEDGLIALISSPGFARRLVISSWE